jgi:DNA adenine methylase
MNPPIGRIGGKSRIAKQIIELFPPDNTYTTYIEPFVGAGNIIYRIPYNPKHLEIINDLDNDMYRIFKGVQMYGIHLKERLPKKTITKKQFINLKDKKDIISLLLRYKISYKGAGKYINPSIKSTPFKTTKFNELQERLKNVNIFNEDFTTIINQYNNKKVFFYLDPPYEESKDYPNAVNPIDVYNAVKKIKGKFMLSYNDSPLIRNIFKNYNIQSIITKYQSPPRDVMELIITNY